MIIALGDSASTIDEDGLALDIGVFFISQEDGQVSYVADIAETADRDFLEDGIEVGLGRVIDAHHGTGIDEAWRNGIYIDTQGS